MRVYLFRHAERENSGQNDPSLNARGRRQAEILRDRILRGEWDKPDRIWVSPRKRAVQTMTPLLEALTMTPLILNELDERQNMESGSQFSQRVRRLLMESTQTSGVTYLVTHLDWIEEAMIAIPSPDDLLSPKHQAWEPGKHMFFDVQDGLWQLMRFEGISV